MQSKKPVILACLQLLIAIAVSGQASFGFKAGATLSFPHASKTSGPPPNGSSYYTSIEDVEGRGGVLIGVFASIPLSRQFQLRPSAEIGFRSIIPKVSTQYGSYGYRQPVSYMDFPIPVTYVLQKKGSKWLMGAGPSLSVLLNPTYQQIAFDKELDFGVNGLFAFETDIGFSINMQYLYGLTNLAANQDFKNRFLNFSIGYLF